MGLQKPVYARPFSKSPGRDGFEDGNPAQIGLTFYELLVVHIAGGLAANSQFAGDVNRFRDEVLKRAEIVAVSVKDK